MLDRLMRAVVGLAALLILAGCQEPAELPGPTSENPNPTVMPLFAVTQNVDVTDLGSFATGGFQVALLQEHSPRHRLVVHPASR